MGRWNYIRLTAQDRPIPVSTTHGPGIYTGTIHTIAVSLHESLLAIECLH